ncbi:MAG: hypothetical protein AAGA85_15560 [Bacteroidota bacterium]
MNSPSRQSEKVGISSVIVDEIVQKWIRALHRFFLAIGGTTWPPSPDRGQHVGLPLTELARQKVYVWGTGESRHAIS